jgi:GT2 family glycosyltransferase
VNVTVLMAVHNGGAYLREAVESVLAQTYGDFELLVVDDASDDGSAELAESFGDPRIRVLRNASNLGQVPSLNLGLRKARGGYVARLDADDTMLPTRLERQVAILDAEPRVALVGTWLDVVDADGRLWSQLRGELDGFAGFVSAVLSDSFPFGHPSLTFRRDVVLELGGYDAELAPSEDKDLYRRLALAHWEARVVPEPLVRYRRHAGQLSQRQTRRQLATDHEGQERFLAELSPDSPAASLRLLLAADPDFWVQPPLTGPELESLLDGATRRLRLTQAEREIVARTIARRCRRAVIAGWSCSARNYGERARGPAGFAAVHGEPATVLLVPAIRLVRPVGTRLAESRSGVRHVLRHERLAPIRRRASRSRTLRRLYTKIVGFRLLDD